MFSHGRQGRSSGRFWPVYWSLVVILVAAHAAHALFGLGRPGLDSFFNDWVYTGLYFSPLPAVIARAVADRGERLPGVVLWVWLSSYGLATVIYSVFYAWQASPPFPSLSDGLWLVLYPCSLTAIVLLVSARLYRANRILILDGIIGALTASALLSAVALNGLQDAVHGALLERAVTLAYPLGDLLLLSIIVTVFAAMAWRPDRFWALLCGGFIVLVVADSFYVSQSAAGTYQQGGVLDTCWPLAMLLIGLAARRPERIGSPEEFGSRTLVVPAAAGVGLVVLEVLANRWHVSGLAEALATVALAALIVRLLVSLLQVQSLAASHKQARTDPLTGLLNRRGFDEQLAGEAERARRDGSHLAIVVFDLDRFKQLNDRFGHAEGDRALCRLATLLRRTTRQIDTIARLGGEEFILLAPATDREGALRAAERIRIEVKREFDADLALTVSAGMAIFPDAATEPADAVQAADDALYAEKRAGRDRCVMYRETDMRRGARRRRGPGADEDRAEVVSLLERSDAIVPHFQPIVALTTGRVAGYEALARFPGTNPRPPDVWFAQARACGLGPDLEAQALRAALSCPGRPAGTFLTLNVSPSALASREVASVLPDDLSDVILELTEHEVIGTSRTLDHTLAELRDHGARIALDDVGSAYSGLQTVVGVRPDIIKIDRDLTSGVHGDPAKSALIESFVSFAHSTHAAVCAEGIEHLGEALFLADLDVLYGQGYRLARPASPWAGVDPEVSDALLRRSLTGDTEAGAALPPDTRGRRLELVIARLSAVSSMQELDELMPLVAQELNAAEAYVSDWNVEAGYVESVTGPVTGPDDRYWLADYPSTAHALHAQEAVQVLAAETRRRRRRGRPPARARISLAADGADRPP